MKEKQVPPEEQSWRTKMAKTLAYRHAPQSLKAVYEMEDAENTALLSMHKAWLDGKPRNYQITCGSRAIIDDVRFWLGRTGGKIAIAVPSTSLDSETASDWMPNLKDSQGESYQKELLAESSFEDLLSSLPTDTHRAVVRASFEDELSVKQTAAKLGLPQAEAQELLSSSLSLLRNHPSLEYLFLGTQEPRTGFPYTI